MFLAVLQQNLRDLDVPAPKDKDAPVLIVDWPEDVSDYSPLHIENGSKFVLLMDVVDLSVALGEKVLIFRLGVVICVVGGGGRWWERCVGISSAVVEWWRGCAWKWSVSLSSVV